MIAAFIIAVRGTITQAILLGLAATVSHTAVVWIVALVGMRLGGQWNAEATEPYFQVASAVLIIGIAVWMIWRTWRNSSEPFMKSHEQHHNHRHGEGVRRIDTGHGVLALEVFEDGVPPRWRIRTEGDRPPLVAASRYRRNGAPGRQPARLHVHRSRRPSRILRKKSRSPMNSWRA